MPIEIQCPDCSKRYRVKDELAGKTLPCKACGGRMKVGRAAPAPPPPEEDLWGDGGFEDEPAYGSPPPRKKAKKAGSSKKSTASGSSEGPSVLKRIGGILAIVLGALIAVSSVVALINGTPRAARGIGTGIIMIGVGIGWLRGTAAA
ncbi:MAG: hypothetical protein R3C49_03805 [Planctomycetaceae bacterium]